MSSYLNIYMRKAKTQDVALVSFQSSSKMYELFQDAFGTHLNYGPQDQPYCDGLTEGDLRFWINYIQEQIRLNKKTIQKHRKLQQYIKQTQASLEEILSEYYESDKMIEFLEEEINMMEEAYYTVNFLLHFANEQELYEDGKWPNTQFIFAGIDGWNPYPNEVAE